MLELGCQADLIDDLAERVEAGMRDWRATTDPSARQAVTRVIAEDIHRVLDVIEADVLASPAGDVV
jgi:hypothetical protein